MIDKIGLKLVLLSLLSIAVLGCSNGSSGTVPDLSQPTGGTYQKLSAGTSHTCAINSSNNLKCWGRNQHGQLGDGTMTDKTVSTFIDSSVQYSQVSAGDAHTCAITTTGILKCWGKNSSGQLGDSTTTDRLTPIVIDAGTNYSQISVSGNVTCGITTANLLKCWGYNGFGAVGDGTIVDKDLPVTIDVVTYSIVAVGAMHTCGITTAGLLKCWGLNDSGQLGDTTTANKVLPTAIDVATTYTKIAVSSFTLYHSCGITTAGVLKCWGNNTYGQLGIGVIGTALAAPQIVSAGTTFSDISVGYVHSCAVKSTTTELFCWGYNFFSQLGDYTSTNRSSPVQGDTGYYYSKVVASNNYTCGLTADGHLRCWGQNDFGQLGDGSIVDRYVPIGINQLPSKNENKL